MLSNTADTKPSTSVDRAEASGRLSTGIIDAHRTSASRNTAPFAAFGTAVQSGRRHGASSRMMPMTVRPMYGNRSPFTNSTGAWIIRWRGSERR
jgi:hypothetical protein